MNERSLIRQSEVVFESTLDTCITVVGAGAIGSFTTLALSKMGFRHITVWDDDEVEEVNLNAQLYGLGDIGALKITALSGLCYQLCNQNVSILSRKFRWREEMLGDGIVISAVDSMSARREMWEHCKECYGSIPLMIDPRMAVEYARIFAMRPEMTEDVTTYEKTLHSDDNAVQERCTAKATVYTALLISGLICKIIKDFLQGGNYYRIVDWDIGQNCMRGYRLNDEKVSGIPVVI